ncbi:PLP-dependent transferase, partial [Mesorhizobium japonicum]|uniref:PLP-dependent transferase n=1 Tax=Mesorhizobium japonicum TaxID=2066070 RepID=UPI003B5A25F1
PDEVRFLMGFNREVLHRRRDQLNEWGVRVRWSGRTPRLWRSVVDALRLFTHMSHLGDVRSLVQHPETSSHSSRSPEERLRSGIRPGTLRLSIGIEDVDD